MGNAEYMGSPRQTFAGETRSSRQCRWPRAAKGWSASCNRYILTFRNSLDPASLLKTKRKRIRTQRSQDCLPSENIYRRQKDQPTPKRPNTFRSVVDLSTTVFQDELFKKLKPSKKEKKTEAFLHFLKSKKSSSQLVFELSLVKTISPIHRPTLLVVERRHFQTSMKS